MQHIQINRQRASKKAVLNLCEALDLNLKRSAYKGQKFGLYNKNQLLFFSDSLQELFNFLKSQFKTQLNKEFKRVRKENLQEQLESLSLYFILAKNVTRKEKESKYFQPSFKFV
ncbi:hypothetical protein [Helicobacter winghamensis]|uniref:hypothetical protein n=1 Tax=Helicobacter winghamensis TaxID=157268 RepID=UPI0018A4CD98|nr:hypothetical protein [Helicobacter winghamensis]QOQ98587.1 hypothetical protein A0Z60_03165 [Helicobacter winghamensis]